VKHNCLFSNGDGWACVDITLCQCSDYRTLADAFTQIVFSYSYLPSMSRCSRTIRLAILKDFNHSLWKPEGFGYGIWGILC